MSTPYIALEKVVSDSGKVKLWERFQTWTSAKQKRVLDEGCIVFQILYTLACFQEIGLQQNDLHTGNILLDVFEANPLPYVIYRISRTKVVILTDVEYIPRIYDFDRSTTFPDKSVPQFQIYEPEVRGKPQEKKIILPKIEGWKGSKTTDLMLLDKYIPYVDLWTVLCYLNVTNSQSSLLLYLFQKMRLIPGMANSLKAHFIGPNGDIIRDLVSHCRPYSPIYAGPSRLFTNNPDEIMSPKTMLLDSGVLRKFKESPKIRVVEWDEDKLDIFSHAINVFQLPSLSKIRKIPPSPEKVFEIRREFWEKVAGRVPEMETETTYAGQLYGFMWRCLGMQ